MAQLMRCHTELEIPVDPGLGRISANRRPAPKIAVVILREGVHAMRVSGQVDARRHGGRFCLRSDSDRIANGRSRCDREPPRNGTSEPGLLIRVLTKKIA